MIAPHRFLRRKYQSDAFRFRSRRLIFHECHPGVLKNINVISCLD
jgi:hypothetical protein